ncbi:SGNH hydrolase-type esterase domain-containing protein [Entophlyctis helioformis]|nr:SGNH hydrolase-type esterase domain-containing protein [Entophlyctis helioformis]
MADKLCDVGQDRILLFGDSLTQRGFKPATAGWTSHLADAYLGKADIVNRGYSGYNTDWCRQILPSVVRSLAPHPSLAPSILFATLFLGANDAALPDVNPHQHVPVDRYAANVESMIQTLRASATDRIVLITPPPLHEADWAAYRKSQGGVLDRRNSFARQYRDASIRVATALGVPYIDTWTVFLGSDLADRIAATAELSAADDAKIVALFEDGLHFSAQGNALLYKAVKQLVKREWPHLDADSLPSVMPYWANVDTANIAESLLGGRKVLDQ